MPSYDADFDARMKDLMSYSVKQEVSKRNLEAEEAKEAQEEFNHRHTFVGALEGLANGIGDYFTGLGQAWSELQRASQAYNEADIYDYAGANDDLSIDPKDIPAMNDYQMDAFRWKINAEKQFASVAGRGIGTAAAMAGLAASGAGIAGLATGSTALMGAASTLSTVGGAAMLASLPSTVMDMTDNLVTSTANTNFSDPEQVSDYTDNLTNTFLPMVPVVGDAYSVIRRLTGNDQEWNDLWRVNPGAAYAQLAVDIGQVATPIAYRAFAMRKAKAFMKEADVDSIKDTEEPKKATPPPSANPSPSSDSPNTPPKAKDVGESNNEQVPHQRVIRPEDRNPLDDAPPDVRENIEERMMKAKMTNLEEAGEAMAKAVKEGKIRPKEQSVDERIITNMAQSIKENGAAPYKVNEPPEVALDIASDDGGRAVEVTAPNEPKLVRYSEIYNAANELTAVREGGMNGMLKGGTYGYFETFNEGIRIAKRMDLPTTSHEIGHFLDKVLNIKGADNELIWNAIKVWGTNTYAYPELRGEGIAEFTREYTLNPEFARKNFHEYTVLFEAEMAKHPELLKKWNNYNELVRRWYYQGGQARVGGAIALEDVRPKVSLKERLAQMGHHMNEQLFDGQAVLQHITDIVEQQIGQTLPDDKNPIRKARALKSFSQGLSLALTQHSGVDSAFMRALSDLTGYIWKNDTLLADVWSSLDAEGLNAKYGDWYKKIGANDTYEAFATWLVSKSARRRAQVATYKITPQLEETLHKWLTHYKSLPNGSPKKEAWANANREKIVKLWHRLQTIKRTGIDPEYKLPFKLEDADMLAATGPEEFIKAADKMKKFNSDLLGFMVSKGLIDESTRKYLLNVYGVYVPWQRVFESDMESAPIDTIINKWFDEDLPNATHAKGSLADLTPAIKALTKTGSDRMIKDPLVGSCNNVFTIVSKALRNDIAKSVTNLLGDRELRKMGLEGLSDLLMQVPDQNAKPSDKTRMFYVYDKGKKVLWQATDPLLYEALAGTDVASTKNALQLTLATMADLKRFTTTSSAGFAVTNFLRDTFTAMVRSRSNKWLPVVPIWDSVQGVFLQHPKDEKGVYLNALMEIAGVKNANLRREDTHIKANVRSLMGGKTPVSPSGENFIKAAMTYGKKLYYGYTGVLDEIEMAPRIREAERLLREKNSLWKSIEGAREITMDFSKGGKATKKLNTYVPFLNANMQGLKNFFGTYSGNEININKALFRTSLLVGAGVALWALNHNDEWYRNLDPDIKNRFFCINVGNDTVMTIPKPEGFGALISAAERTLDYCYDNDKEAPGYLGDYIRGAFSPSATTFALAPIAEYVFNYDFFRNRDLIPQNLKKVRNDLQYNSSTSELGKKAGSLFGISPMAFDHMIRGYLGNIGSEVILNGSNILMGDNDKPAKDVTQMPVVSRLFRNVNIRTAPTQIFQDKLKEAQKEAASKAMEANGTIKGTKKYKDDTLKIYEKADKNIKRAYQIINEINNPKSKLNKNTSPMDKASMINEQQRKIVQESIKALRKTGNTYYR